MDLDRIILFCHVVAMIGLFANLAIESVGLRFLRRATSYEQSREWIKLWSLLVPFGVPSALVSLASGIYLAITLGAWNLDWVKVAVPTLVIVALAGGIVGPRRNRLQAAIARNDGPLSYDLLVQIRHPLLRASLWFRAALLAGLVFDMTARPDSSVLVIVTMAFIGILCSLSAWRRGPAKSIESSS